MALVAGFSLAFAMNGKQKPEYKDSISAVLGELWKVDIGVRQVCAYVEAGYAAEAPGSMIQGKFTNRIYEGLVSYPVHRKFGEDDMLHEAFHEGRQGDGGIFYSFITQNRQVGTAFQPEPDCFG
ncbi:hypothetical protein ACQKWADRAFT_312662 [Trichoderma austrokoningii]